MARAHEDRYTNLAAAVVVESAASTITYIELLTGISLGQGIGMLIDQIDYHIDQGVFADLTGADDQLVYGWGTSNSPTSIGVEDRRFIHVARTQKRAVIGTAASAAELTHGPLVYQFFPAMIVANPRLYLAVQGISLASPATIGSRLYFRYIPLTDKEYLELAETFILVG